MYILCTHTHSLDQHTCVHCTVGFNIRHEIEKINKTKNNNNNKRMEMLKENK